MQRAAFVLPGLVLVLVFFAGGVLASGADDALNLRHVAGPFAPGIVGWDGPSPEGLRVSWVEVPLVGAWRVAVDPAELPLAWVDGRLVDDDGLPVEGAVVYLLTSRHGSERDRWGRPSAESRRSDEAGRFRFAVDPEESVALEIWAEGFQTRRAYGVLGRRDAAPREIELERARELEGRVVRSGGEPLPEVRISIVEDGASETRSGVPGPRAWTDARGEFRLAVDPDREPLRLRAFAFERGSEVVEVPPLAPGEVLEIVVDPPSVVRGRVVDPAGEAVADARLSIERADPADVAGERDPTDFWGRFGRGAKSEADGSFRFLGLGPGLWEISVTHPGHEPRSVEREISVHAGEEEDLGEIEIEPALRHRVEGRVVADAGPVDGLRVSLSQVSGGVWVATDPLVAVTAGGGGFALDAVPPGRYRVTVEGGPAAGGDAVGVLDPGDLHLVVDGPMRVELHLLAPASVGGRVRGVDPQDLLRTHVVATFGYRGSRRGVVDAAGSTYRIEGLPPGRVRVRAFVRDTSREVEQWVRIPAGESEVLLDLDLGRDTGDGHRLAGRVLRDDRPLADARLRLMGAEKRFLATDAAGTFALESLPPGVYRLVVWDEGTAWSGEGSRTPVHVEEIELEGDENVEIRVPGDSAVSGSVRDATGSALGGVRLVMGRDDVGVVASSTTDATGRFRFPTVAAGAWELRASREGYAPIRRLIEVAEADVEIEIEMEASPSLELRLRRPDGSTPPFWQVALLDDEGLAVAWGGKIGPDGTVTLDSVPEGTWRLVAWSPDEGFAAWDTGVRAPGPTLELVAPPTASVEIEIPELAEVSRASFVLLDASGRPFRLRLPQTLDHGWAILSKVPAGRWTVFAEGPDGRTWRKAFVARPGASQRVSLP